jgi:hypothetical protein
MDMDLEALPVNIGDLKGKGFLEPEAQAVDGGEVDLVVQGRGGHEESPDLLHAEDSRKTVGGLRTQEGEGVPVALKDVLVEKADATVTDAHRRGGEAVDVCAV